MGIDMSDHPVFKLKGRLYTFTVVQLLSADKALFEVQLSKVVEQAPKLFDNTPIVLDCSLLTDEHFDLAGFCQLLSAYGMIPVAIQGGLPIYAALAEGLHLHVTAQTR